MKHAILLIMNKFVGLEGFVLLQGSSRHPLGPVAFEGSIPKQLSHLHSIVQYIHLLQMLWVDRASNLQLSASRDAGRQHDLPPSSMAAQLSQRFPSFH